MSQNTRLHLLAAFHLLAALMCGLAAPSHAVEGSAIAGPIGGTDIRSAQLPPPGLYGGIILLDAVAHGFVDGKGKVVPALSELRLHGRRAGPFVVYVPDVQVFGGSIGFAGILPGGVECGRLFAATPRRCINGIGDPYLEAAWSRYFGMPRPSGYPGAFPIAEGLTLSLGFGAVIPLGRYNEFDAKNQGLTIGNNIYDYAPIVALNYMTKPIVAEGTEFSAKLYWNNYLTNPVTQYSTGSVINVDFAVSERIGRFQFGLAGFYAFQIADDKVSGVSIPPDGRRAEVLELGGVVAYDMPDIGASMKLKGLTTVITANTVKSYGVVFGLIKKFQ